jgi:hypothetical protein
MNFNYNRLLGKKILPVDIVLAPEWWFKNTGITFDRDFFFHPARRVEDEQKMEKTLYERWGKYGFGKEKDLKKPEIGAVHLAAGFLLSEMLGCKVNYSESHPPQVVPSHIDDLRINEEDIFKSEAYKRFQKTCDKLKEKHGYLTGDVNWSGILNLALDVRGENIFLDMMTDPDITEKFFGKIAGVIEKFTHQISRSTGTTSISVNRDVRHFENQIFLHSECSHTMISEDDYEKFLLPFDIKWSKKRPFGIHYCGPDPHRMAAQFSKVPNLDYLDVGWGGEIKILRKHLPDTFFSIRLSPVELINMTANEITGTIKKLVSDSGNPYLTGICCINMDDKISDEKVTTIIKTVEEVRKQFVASGSDL